MDIEKFINNFIENSKKSFTFSNLKKNSSAKKQIHLKDS